MSRNHRFDPWKTSQSDSEDPTGFGHTNRTLCIVAGGSIVIALMIIISIFSLSKLHPSLFLPTSDDIVASFGHQEIKVEEYQYYLYQAAEQSGQEISYWKDKKHLEELQEQVLVRIQTDRMYPLLAEQFHLSIPDHILREQEQEQEAWKKNKGTPLGNFQLQSKGITEELQQSLIETESYRETLKEYVTAQTDETTLLKKAKEIYDNSYVKVRWIRFSLVDGTGTLIPEEEQEQLRIKSYGIYQKLQSEQSFDEIQDELTGEKQIMVYDQLIEPNQIESELEQTVFSLQINEIGAPVETKQAIFLMQRIDAESGFESRKQEMLYRAQDEIFEEWMDSHRSEYPIKPYRNAIKKLDVIELLQTFSEQKKEADKQIEYIEKSK